MTDTLPIHKLSTWLTWGLVALASTTAAVFWAWTRPARPTVTVAVLSFATLAALAVVVLAIVGVRRRPRIEDRRAFVLLFLVIAVVRGYAGLFVSLELIGPHVDGFQPVGIAFLAGGWLVVDSLLVGVIIWLGNFSARGRVITFHRVGRILRAIDAATSRLVPPLARAFRAVGRWAGFRVAGAPGQVLRLPLGRAAFFWFAWIAVVMASLALLVSTYGARGDAWFVLSNGALVSFMIAASGYQGYVASRSSWIRVAGTIWLATLAISGLSLVPRDVSAWPGAGLFAALATVGFAAYVFPAWFRARRSEAGVAGRQDSAT